jgi:hypothetical protein
VTADSHKETQRIVVHIGRVEILELFMLLAFYLYQQMAKMSEEFQPEFQCS